MWELDCEESWVLKNWCFWTVVLEKTLESPLDCKEIQPSILKEISPGISLEGMMLKLKLQTFAISCEELSHWKRLWCWKGLWAGGEGDDREWDSWMALLTWRESEWTLGVGDGQVGLVCCDSWGRIESDMTQQLSWLTELILYWCFSFWTSVYVIGSNFIHLIRTYSNAFFLIAE